MNLFPLKHLSSIILVTLFLCLIIHRYSCRAQKVPNYIFGDSLVDAGNNNYIVTLSKANYPPNGIDFGSPTGRYTNGRTIVDIIGQQVGFGEFTPPYLAPTTKGNSTMRGVNYASGGGGILNETGSIFGGRLNMDAQLDDFANTRQDIINSIGEAAAKEHFQKALYSVTMGSNDFINNYLTPVISTVERAFVSSQEFVDSAIFKYRQQLTRLYSMGARKIIVVNVGPIGCIPYLRDLNPTMGDDCIPFPNQLAVMFNLRLKNLVTVLNNNLEGSKFVYADIYNVFSDILSKYTSYGFENPNSACCYSSGRFGGLVPCGPTSRYCNDRSKYVFWDPYHPSEAANLIIANRLMNGDTNDISPINVRQLINL